MQSLETNISLESAQFSKPQWCWLKQGVKWFWNVVGGPIDENK